MAAGVTARRPGTHRRARYAQLQQHVFIDVGCVFRRHGNARRQRTHRPNCVLRDATIGAGSAVHPMTISKVVPWVRVLDRSLRAPAPGYATLGDEVRISSFVEVKNSTLAVRGQGEPSCLSWRRRWSERVNYGAGLHYQTTTAPTNTAP